MCGICGYIQRASSPHRPIERMTARLAHRGPDGQGIQRFRHGDWAIALGHRRLSIIDVEGGHQPLANEDESVWVTFNGEIYNFHDLRRRLCARGHQFRTRCDTEVIVHGYEETGHEMLRDLHGMFALALWDQRAGRLLLARDRIGIKPLYYAPLEGGGIAFASELAALLEHPALSRDLDPDGLTSLFFLDYIQPPHTIVRGARKLAPAHFLSWSGGSLVAPRPFWKLSIPCDAPVPSIPVAARDLREKLDRAVTSQLISDVPLGVFLSGGIDSSLVAALAARHTDQPIMTFSIAFEDPAFDESCFARQVASHIGSRHFQRTLTESTLLDILDQALDALDEPIGDPSILPTYLLSDLAAQHVKVALGGDGGDELWAGYPTYLAHRFAHAYRHIPRPLRDRVLHPLVSRFPLRDGYQSLEWKLKRFASRWDDHDLTRHLRWMSNTDLPDLSGCFPEPLAWPHGVARLTKRAAGTSDTLNQILALDLATYLPGAVLTKVDRASMIHGLEVRPPMLDESLIDFAFSLPSSMKLRGRTTKFLLKQVATQLLPDRIVHRKKKGFAIPLARWLKGPLRCRLETVIHESPLWQTSLLNRATFQQWFAEHQAGQIDRSKPLWALLVLDHWHTRISDPAPASRAPAQAVPAQ